MADLGLLRAQAPIVLQDGRPTPEFYAYLLGLDRTLGTDYADQFTALASRIAALEEGQSIELRGVGSITIRNNLVMLVNDETNPIGSAYYGTDADGAQGWYQRLLASLADVDLTGLADRDTLVWDQGLARWVPSTPDSGSVRVTATFDAGTGDIEVGSQCEVFVPFGFRPTRVTMVSPQESTIEIDVLATSLGAYPSLVSICAGLPPSSAASRTYQADTPTWSIVSVPSVIRFAVVSAFGAKRVTLTVEGEKT